MNIVQWFASLFVWVFKYLCSNRTNERMRTAAAAADAARRRT